MNHQTPVVSAVIPTRNRPELVSRAVRSVLSQTVGDIECIVVIDGPDMATDQALREIADSAVASDGASGKRRRMRGQESRRPRCARAEWVALLDDDDEWLPYRLEKQLAAVASAANR